MIALRESAEQVTVSFEDGTTVQADLLIGADGTHSLTRQYVLGEQVQRRYAGYVNWNGLVKCSDKIAPPKQWTTYVADGKRASLMPVADNRFYFFLDVPLPAGLENNRDDYKPQLKEYFAGWCPQVQTLIDELDPQTTN